MMARTVNSLTDSCGSINGRNSPAGAVELQGFVLVAKTHLRVVPRNAITWDGHGIAALPVRKLASDVRARKRIARAGCMVLSQTYLLNRTKYLRASNRITRWHRLTAGS